MTKGIKAILWTCVGLVAFVILGVAIGPPSPNTTERRAAVQQPPSSRPSAEVTNAPSVSDKMATIQSGSGTPPAEMVERFRTALTRLSAHCPDPPERIGDFLVSGQRLLAAKGKRTSLIVLTESVGTMLDTASNNGGIPEMKSCAEPVALMVTALQGNK